MHKIRNRFIINIYRVFNILLLSAFSQACLAFQLQQRNPIEVTFKNEEQKIKADGFKVAEVTADKEDAGIGTTINPANNDAVAITLKTGTANAVRSYIKQNIEGADNGKPVRISIKQLKVTEMSNATKAIDGNLQLQFSFDLITGDDLYVHLVNYKSATRYTRLPNQTIVIEQYLRAGIRNSLKFFGEWLDKHKNNDPALANNVKLIFNDYTEQPEDDTIYYKANRPLKWDDFRDKPRSGIYSAEVMPGLGYTESNSVKEGQLIVEINMKVYLPKSAAWVKPGEENATNLNHEQRHFDIVKIVSERFKRKMLKEILPVQNYNGYINVEYFEALREINAMQKQYDLETRHGSDFVQQEKWDRHIDTELATSKSGG